MPRLLPWSATISAAAAETDLRLLPSAVAAEARIALTLRLVCGLSTTEIVLSMCPASPVILPAADNLGLLAKHGKGDASMGTVADTKAEWILRVLGIDPRGGGQAAAVPAGTVAYRRALLNFARAKTSVATQLGQLSAAIVGTLPEEAGLADAVATELAELNEEIADAVDEAMTAGGGPDARTRSLMQAYVDRLASDPLVEHVDANPFVRVDIQATLTGALDSILATMR